MAVIERTADSIGAAPGTPRGFRPTSRRRARLAAGAVIAAIGIGGNVLLYSSLDDSVEVVQAVSTLRQGQRIQATDLRVVEVELDDTVPVVPGDQLDLLVGQYARTYIGSGTLLIDVMVQSEPLVTPGQGVVAVEIRPTQVPRDLRERSQVFIVVPGDDTTPFFVFRGRVISRSDTTGDGQTGDVISLSIEVAQADGPTIAAADDVRIVLVEPGVDPLAAVPAATSATSTIAPSAAAPSTTAPSQQESAQRTPATPPSATQPAPPTNPPTNPPTSPAAPPTVPPTVPPTTGAP